MRPSQDSSSAAAVLFGLTPPAPREPSDLARRLLFRPRAEHLILMFVGAFFVILGSLFSSIFLWNLPSDVALSLSATSTTGRVLSVEDNVHVTVDGVHPTVTTFEFRVDGQRYQAESSELAPARVAAVGDAVKVEYSPSRPSWARVAGGKRNAFGTGPVLVLLFPFTGLALFLAGLVSWRRIRKAFTWGTPVTARKESFAEDLSVRVNGVHPWALKWAFEVDGKTYRGKISSMRPEDLAGLAARDALPVLYLEGRPQTNTLYVP